MNTRAGFVLLIVVLQLFASPLLAGVIKGKITDAKGVVLPYATIYIQGTTKGVSANAYGNYELIVEPGTYKVVCQYIGFTQSTRSITITGNEIVEQDFVLKEEGLQMKAVVVHANTEDPAYGIIRKTIARRPFHLQQVRSFQSAIYLKGVARSRIVPGNIMGQKVDKADLGVDTGGKGVLYLCEEEADYYSKEPNKHRTIIHSVRQSGNPNGMGFSQVPSVITFYENNIAIFNPRGFVSPVSDNAIHYYKYKLLGEFKEEGITIYKIDVKPRRLYEPLFTGTIYIADGDWAIHSLSMTLTGKANLDMLDTITIDQVYLPLKKDTWVVKNQVFYFTMGILGFDITGNFVSVYNKQKVNEPMPDTIFETKFISEYDSAANKKDTSYWSEVRPIPLESDEKRDYKIKDSIRLVEEDPRYIDSMRRINNKIGIANIVVSGVTYKTKGSKDIIQTNSVLSGMVGYNTVEGLNIAPKAIWMHRLDSSNSLLGRAAVRYGVSNTHFNAMGRLSYAHADRSWQGKGWQLGVEGGKYIFQYNPDNPVPELYNTFTTLVYDQNHLKIYERWNTALFYKKYYGNGWKWNVRLAYQQRLPLENTTNYTWSGDADKLTPNVPRSLQYMLWEKHDAVIADAAISYQPGFTYTKYPDHITPHGSSWPTFTLIYQKGIPNVLNSKTDFDKWRFGISQALSLRLLGAISYNIAVGGFLSKNYVSLPDMMHLLGNDIAALPPGFYLHGFELAPYYLYSNIAPTYVEAHIEYNLLGLLTNKIPLLKQARWYALIGTNTFYASENDYYTEAFVGVDNIGFKIFRGIRIDFVKSWDNNQVIRSAIRIGLKIANNIQVNNNIDVGEEW